MKDCVLMVHVVAVIIVLRLDMDALVVMCKALNYKSVLLVANLNWQNVFIHKAHSAFFIDILKSDLLKKLFMKGFKLKSILVFGILFLSFNGYSQEKHFRLIGEIRGIDSGSVSIYSLLPDSTKKNPLSGRVFNGRFVINGNIDHPIKVFLMMSNT